MDKVGLFSDMIVMIRYADCISFPLNGLSSHPASCLVAAGRINEVLELEPTIHIHRPKADKRTQTSRAKSPSKNVTFRYAPGAGGHPGVSSG